jgi:hypothetical protein
MEKLMPALMTCGSGADLCTLPLFVVAVLIAAGVQPAPAQLMWLASPWFIAVTGAIVAIEFALDHTLREPGIKELWNKLQYTISIMVVVTVVLAMGEGMSRGEVLGGIAGGWATTGILKAGLFDRAKGALNTLSGEG